MFITCSRVIWDQPGQVPNSVRGQLYTRKMNFSLSPFSRLRMWSSETALAVPSRVSSCSFSTFRLDQFLQIIARLSVSLNSCNMISYDLAACRALHLIVNNRVLLLYVWPHMINNPRQDSAWHSTERDSSEYRYTIVTIFLCLFVQTLRNSMLNSLQRDVGISYF